MESITSSLYAVAVISVAVGLFDIFSGNKSMEKYTKYIISLVVISALLVPIKSVFFSVDNSFFDKFENSFTEKTEQKENGYKLSVEMSIAQKISGYFSLPISAFETEITAQSNEKETVITNIKLTITDQKYFHLCEKIEAYLKSSFGCEISVIQDFGE